MCFILNRLAEWAAEGQVRAMGLSIGTVSKGDQKTRRKLKQNAVPRQRVYSEHVKALTSSQQLLLFARVRRFPGSTETAFWNSQDFETHAVKWIG
jgi:hypothetical protein